MAVLLPWCCEWSKQHCTVKHHTDIINFAFVTWNFVRILASLSALCTNINQICHCHCISFKIRPHFDVRTISVAQKTVEVVSLWTRYPQIASLCIAIIVPYCISSVALDASDWCNVFIEMLYRLPASSFSEFHYLYLHWLWIRIYASLVCRAKSTHWEYEYT